MYTNLQMLSFTKLLFSSYFKLYIYWYRFDYMLAHQAFRI